MNRSMSTRFDCERCGCPWSVHASDRAAFCGSCPCAGYHVGWRKRFLDWMSW